MRPVAHPLLALLATALLGGASRADVVELTSGGRVEGSVVTDPERSRNELVIENPWGRVVVPRTAAAKITTRSPAEVEYERRAPTVSDTVESQLALARWCRDNGLAEQVRTHLARVVELDPEHAEARKQLGHQQVGGRWMSRDEVLAARGLVRHQGAYRTHQEVELLERQRLADEKARGWKARLRALRRDLDDRRPEVARNAADALASLGEPGAAGPLAELLLEERDPLAKQLLARAAAALPSPATLGAVARVAIDDDNPETRAAAAEALQAAGERGAQGLAGPFVGALGAKSNETVNRAADALALLGREQSIGPLIDALVTVHKFRVGNDGGGDTYSMNTGTGQYSFGGGGPKVISQPLENPRVLEALVGLTGENFGFDEPAWRAWLASRQIDEQFDLRRDP
ncbi:MAG: hypothetical protein ACRCT8_04460 [Lacipirellulaceae bacterium]